MAESSKPLLLVQNTWSVFGIKNCPLLSALIKQPVNCGRSVEHQSQQQQPQEGAVWCVHWHELLCLWMVDVMAARLQAVVSCLCLLGWMYLKLRVHLTLLPRNLCVCWGPGVLWHNGLGADISECKVFGVPVQHAKLQQLVWNEGTIRCLTGGSIKQTVCRVKAWMVCVFVCRGLRQTGWGYRRNTDGPSSFCLFSWVGLGLMGSDGSWVSSWLNPDSPDSRRRTVVWDITGLCRCSDQIMFD